MLISSSRSSEIHSGESDITGYQVIRKDPNGNGGEVAVYVSDDSQTVQIKFVTEAKAFFLEVSS